MWPYYTSYTLLVSTQTPLWNSPSPTTDQTTGISAKSQPTIAGHQQTATPDWTCHGDRTHPRQPGCRGACSPPSLNFPLNGYQVS